MAEEKYRAELPNKLVLEDRSRLTISGVTDVSGFDEQAIVMDTSQGALIVRGSGLHMERLSLDSGEVALAGTIDSLEYQALRRKGSLLGRLFR